MNSYTPTRPGWLTNLLPGYHQVGEATDASTADSNALVLRILDEAASKRPPIELFDPGQSDPMQAPPLNPLGTSREAQYGHPMPSGSADASIQRLLDAAVSRRPIGLFDPTFTAARNGGRSAGGQIPVQPLPATSQFEWPRIESIADRYDFLNHGVSADLRFRDVLRGLSGRDHGFIVVRDPESASEFQAGPSWGYPPPFGRIEATAEVYGPKSRGYNVEPHFVSSYISPLPADEIAEKLKNYGAAVNREDFTYVPWGPNSNTYITGAWRELTGSVPPLPDDINAPGYGRTLYLRR